MTVYIKERRRFQHIPPLLFSRIANKKEKQRTKTLVHSEVNYSHTCIRWTVLVSD